MVDIILDSFQERKYIETLISKEVNTVKIKQNSAIVNMYVNNTTEKSITKYNGEYKAANTDSIRKYLYDENGKVIKIEDHIEDCTYTFVRNEDDVIIQMTKTEGESTSKIYTPVYNNSGLILTLSSEDDYIYLGYDFRRYNEGRIIRRMYNKDMKLIQESILHSLDNSIESIKTYDYIEDTIDNPDGNKPALTCSKTFAYDLNKNIAIINSASSTDCTFKSFNNESNLLMQVTSGETKLIYEYEFNN